MKEINLVKNTKELLGQKFMRGCPIEKPFWSHTIGVHVGNIRTALTFLSRENLSKELVAKGKISKKELDLILTLPKKKIKDYDNVLESLLTERIKNDLDIAIELSKHYCKSKNYFNVFFVSKDENGRPLEDMNRYCKILNRLMINPSLVILVLDLALNPQVEKPRRGIRIIRAKDLLEQKVFDKGRPFGFKGKAVSTFVSKAKVAIIKKEVIIEKKKEVKNFKKDLPYTKK